MEQILWFIGGCLVGYLATTWFWQDTIKGAAKAIDEAIAEVERLSK